MTGKMGYMMTVDRTVRRALMAKLEVDTPHFTGIVEALCLKDSLFDLIIGNISGARKPDDPNPDWTLVAAVVTRAQAKESPRTKSHKVRDMSSQYAVSKEEMVNW